MKKPIRLIPIAALALACGSPFAAPIVYPAKGQAPAQQQKDQGECDAWAVQNTGIDPRVLASQPVSAAPSAPPPDPSTVGGGERARGAVRGAVGGAAIGAIAGDTGKGAGVGAVAGVMAGGHRARSNKAAEQQAYQQQQAQSQQQAQAQRNAQMDTYYRAYGACLEGRGYTIK